MEKQNDTITWLRIIHINMRNSNEISKEQKLKALEDAIERMGEPPKCVAKIELDENQLTELVEKAALRVSKESLDCEQNLELANHRIECLIMHMVGYMKGYVGSANCPYKFGLLGSTTLEKPECHSWSCETCKEQFYEDLEQQLIRDYTVK